MNVERAVIDAKFDPIKRVQCCALLYDNMSLCGNWATKKYRLEEKPSKATIYFCDDHCELGDDYYEDYSFKFSRICTHPSCNSAAQFTMCTWFCKTDVCQKHYAELAGKDK